MKKKIVYMTMIMSTIALMSTGFAAWVISGNNSEEKNGNIVVDTVSNESRLISGFTWDGGVDPKIVFSMPEKPTKTFDNPRVTNKYDDSVGYEMLSAKATFEVTNVKDGENLNDIMGIEFSLKDVEEQTNFTTAIEKKYITGIPSLNNVDGWSNFTTISDEKGTAEYGISVKKSSEEASSSNKTKFEIEIKFAWGEIFNYENPYYYYNNLEDFDDSKAQSQLTEMNELLNGVSYNLKIETKSPGTNE